MRLQAARDVISYGLPASIASISWVGFRNCDYAIIGARLGACRRASTSAPYKLAVEYQKKISIVMGQVGLPVLARSGDEMAAMRGHMVRLMTILLFPLLAILAITAPELVPWLFGPEWTAAVVPTQILAVGGASTLVIDAVGVALMASGRPRALLGFGVAHFGTYAGAVLARHAVGPRRRGGRRHDRPHGVHGRCLQAHGPRQRRELGAPPVGRRRGLGDRRLRWAWSPWRCRSASG